MSRIISKIDFLGKRPLIYIAGQSKHKTVIGGLLSILVGVVTLMALFYFFNILISRRNFTVFSVENFNDNQSGDMSMFNLALGASGPTGLGLEDEDRVYTIKANIYRYYPTFVN